MVRSNPSAHSRADDSPGHRPVGLARTKGLHFRRTQRGTHFPSSATLSAAVGPLGPSGAHAPGPSAGRRAAAPTPTLSVATEEGAAGARGPKVSVGRVAALAFPVAALAVSGTPAAWAQPRHGAGPTEVEGPALVRQPVADVHARQAVGATTRPAASVLARVMSGFEPIRTTLLQPSATHAGLVRPPTAPRPVDAALRAPGAVASFGDARFAGSPGHPGRHLVGLSVTPDGAGYWAATAAGSVYSYGSARYFGSVGNHGGAPVSGIASSPSGGYWLVTRAGGVFCFGNARFFGSMGQHPTTSPVVGMAATPDGNGYWLVTAAGGTYTFGDARYFGSLGSTTAPGHVVGIAPTPGGNGYWLATSKGDVYSFGGARFFGSLGSSHVHVTAIAAAPRAQGYWLLTAHGTLHAYGSASMLGSAPVSGTATAATALAPTPDGAGYLVGTSNPAPRLRRARRQGPEVQVRSVAAAATPAAQSYLGTFMVTCYDLSGQTASGAYVGPSSVAVDPSVIPLGTRLYIDGAGMRTADDTGGAIIGRHLDIWEPTYSDCANWGVEYRAVYRVAG